MEKSGNHLRNQEEIRRNRDIAGNREFVIRNLEITKEIMKSGNHVGGSSFNQSNISAFAERTQPLHFGVFKYFFHLYTSVAVEPFSAHSTLNKLRSRCDWPSTGAIYIEFFNSFYLVINTPFSSH